MIKLSPHPDSQRFLDRASALGRTWDSPCNLGLFRFIAPKFSKAGDIINGNGTLHASGRWHVKRAFRASYAATDPETALAEALAHCRYFGLPIQKALPRVLVSLRLKAQRVIDLRDTGLRQALKISKRGITHADWRRENRRGATAATQALGFALESTGFEAIMAPSAAAELGTVVLVFPRNILANSQFKVERKVRFP